MAARVNTRFVVLLVVAVVALLGMVVLAFSVVMKSAEDLAARGDAFMQQGDYKQAEFVYSKAVNKESTNIEYINKWIDSLEQLVPETETEYIDRFYRDYRGAIRQAATALRDDIDAHDRALNITYQILSGGYSRSQADGLIEQTTSALGFFDDGLGVSDEVQDWERLRRYRGIAIFEIYRREGVLQDGQADLGLEDLERAVRADRSDIEGLIKYLTFRIEKINREAGVDDADTRFAVLRENLDLIDERLSDFPDEPTLLVRRVITNLNIDRLDLIRARMQGEEVGEQVERFIEKYQQALADVAERIADADLNRIDLMTVEQLGMLEQMLTQSPSYTYARGLLGRLIEADPENASLLSTAANLAKRATEYDEAYGLYERVSALEVKPLSLDGLRQFELQRRALLVRGEIRVDQAMAALEDSDDSTLNQRIEEAKELRDAYAAQVQEDNASLVLLDGKIANAEGRNTDALRLFKRFNEQTRRENPEGLWHEGFAAFQLGQYGVARDALQLQLTYETDDERMLRSMLVLGRIHEELREYEDAQLYYSDALTIVPNFEPASRGLERVSQIINPELNEDPVLGAILTARSMRTGSADAPGDITGAIEHLRNAAEEFNHDPRIVRELADMLLNFNDIEGTRTLLTRAVELHPEDDSIRSLLDALDAGDTTQILIQAIRGSDRSELEKLVTIASIATARGRGELLSETVEELNRIAPDDRRVIELTFNDALRRDDTGTAEAIAQRSDLSPLESYSYRAQLAAFEGRLDDAIDLLKQADAGGVANASTYDRLGQLLRETGRINESLDAFQTALDIRPDNTSTLREYLITLIGAERFDEALAFARRNQRYAANDQEFISYWLSLEAQSGGEEGRRLATAQRERMLELNPTDTNNTFQLARLYIQQRQWDDARVLIDRLRAENDSINIVELDAQWHAEQGSVNGRNGMVAANEVFQRYIDSLPEPVDARVHTTAARFMMSRGRPDLAIAAAEKAIETQSPDTMDGSRILADIHMTTGNHDQAISVYRSMIDAGVSDEAGQVRLSLIQSLALARRFDEAQQEYDRLPEGARNDLSTMILGANIARGRGDTAMVDQILNEAVSRYPNEPTVYIQRAQGMIGDESLYDDMLSDLDRALRLDSSSWRAYRVRAAGKFAVGRDEEAIEDLRNAVRINPNDAQSINALLNELTSRPGRAGEAASIAREIVARRSDDATIMSQIAALFAARSQWDYAAEFYAMAWDRRRAVNDGAAYIDALIRKSPPDAARANEVINTIAGIVGNIDSSSGLLAAQALVLQARGRNDFAIQQMTKSFQLATQREAELLNWSGNLSRFFEDRPASEYINYVEQLKRATNEPRIRHWLDYFAAYRLLREPEPSGEAFQRIEALQQPGVPDNIALRSYRLHGTMLFTSDQYEEAVRVWRKGLGRFPDDWEMNNNLAYALSSRLGRADEALPFAEKAIAQNPTISEPYETMAGIYIALDKLDEAEQMIETGSRFINSMNARIAMMVTTGRLALARGNTAEAQKQINDARSILRSATSSYPDLEELVDVFEQELSTDSD